MPSSFQLVYIQNDTTSQSKGFQILRDLSPQFPKCGIMRSTLGKKKRKTVEVHGESHGKGNVGRFINDS